MVDDLRRKLDHKKNKKTTVLSIEDSEKKFRHEYEPMIVEEKYTYRGNTFDKS